MAKKKKHTTKKKFVYKKVPKPGRLAGGLWLIAVALNMMGNKDNPAPLLSHKEQIEALTEAGFGEEEAKQFIKDNNNSLTKEQKKMRDAHHRKAKAAHGKT